MPKQKRTIIDTEFEIIDPLNEEKKELEPDPIQTAVEFFKRAKLEASNYAEGDELDRELKSYDEYIEKLQSGNLEDVESVLREVIISHIEILKDGRELGDTRKNKKITEKIIEEDRVIRDALLMHLKDQRPPTEEIIGDQPIIDHLKSIKGLDDVYITDLQSNSLEGLESVYKLISGEIVYAPETGDDPDNKIDKEHLRNLRDALGDRILEARQREKEQGDKSLWQQFKESIVAKKLKGEYVSPEEMSQASKLETAALATGRVADIASSVFGVRLLTRLPDRVLRRHFTNKEIKSFDTILKNQEQTEDGADTGPEDQVTKKIDVIKEKIATSKHLTPEKRQALEQRLVEIQSNYHEKSDSNADEMMGEIGTAIRDHVGERTKNIDLFKDSLNMVGVATGMYAFRAAGMGATMVYERYKKLQEGKKDGEKVKIFKELIYQGAKETIQEMFGQGKLKEIKGWRKIPGILSAWGKPAIAMAVAKAGYSEIAEKGAGAFSLGLGRFKERTDEVSQAWGKFQESGGAGKSWEALKLLGATFNVHETWDRMTFKNWRGGEDGKDIAAQQKDLTSAEGSPIQKTVAAGVAGADVSDKASMVEIPPLTQAEIQETTKQAFEKLINEEVEKSAGTDTTAEAAEAATTAQPGEIDMDKYPTAKAYLENLKAEEKWGLDKMLETEKKFGIDSTQEVTTEDIDKLVEQTSNKNADKAEAVLDSLKEKGAISPEQHFEAKHASLKHAGFTTETVPQETQIPYEPTEQTNISIELGQGGAPKYLEQVFYRMAVDNMELSDEITNVDGARMLNIGANLRELSEGNNIAGATSENFSKYASFEDGKLTITDYEGFKSNVLNKLTVHAEKIITAENVQDTGAVAYIDNIKNATWADMLKPEGIDESSINFDTKMIDQAEGRLFQETLEKTGLGELATNVDSSSESDGSFDIDDQAILIENNSVVQVGETKLDEPVDLDGDNAKKLILEHTGTSNAKELLTNEEKLLAQLKELSTSEKKIEVPESTLELKYDTLEALKATIKDLGFNKGSGVREWEKLQSRTMDDLLNDDIRDISRPHIYWPRQRLDSLREFMSKNIADGKLTPPNAGGPTTIKDAMNQLVVDQTRAQLHYDVSVAEKIVETKEKIAEAATPAETVIEGQSEPTKVNIPSEGEVETSADSTQSTDENTVETATVDHEIETRNKVTEILNNPDLNYTEKYYGLLNTMQDRQIIKIGDFEIQKLAGQIFRNYEGPNPESTIGSGGSDLTSEDIEEFSKIIAETEATTETPVVDDQLEKSIYQASAAETHFNAATNGELSDDRISQLGEEELTKLQIDVKTQIKGLLDSRPLVTDEAQIKIDSVVAGYQEKLNVINQHIEQLKLDSVKKAA